MKSSIVVLSVAVLCLGCKQQPATQKSPGKPTAQEKSPAITGDIDLQRGTTERGTPKSIRSLRDPGIAPGIADAIARADRPSFMDLEVLESAARHLREKGHDDAAAAVLKAVFRLCARAMEDEVTGLINIDAASYFADRALEEDRQSIRGALRSILGEAEGDEAFRSFSKVLRQWQSDARGVTPQLETLISRIPQADVASLDRETARFWRLQYELKHTEEKTTQPALVQLEQPLVAALRKYVEVPYEAIRTGAISPEQKTQLREGFKLAQNYTFSHSGNPWGEYLTVYGRECLYPSYNSEARSEWLARAVQGWPKKQATLTRRLLVALEKGMSGIEERDVVLEAIWRDLVELSTATGESRSQRERK
ncbi:MAG TPA: hypothetical protein VMY42_12430 [Thermoguttaceae bacterium]|nr:hypothetical protein [Thermoguttaceae bacterium]